MGRPRALFVLGAIYEHSPSNGAKRFSTISAALSSRGLAKRLRSPRRTHLRHVVMHEYASNHTATAGTNKRAG